MDPLDFDPLRGIDPLSSLPRAGGARRKTAAFPALSEAQSKPITDSILDKGQSLLHSLGGTLDKAFGARALRGWAYGRPNELKSIIPFSDSLGITNPDDSVSMDDLLVKHAWVKPNNPNAWEFRDFAVPVLEAVADPGTYVSFGAKTLAGQAASKLGKLPKGLASGMRGFDAASPALMAAGKSVEEIAHIAKSGLNVADDATSAAIQAATHGASVEGAPLRGLIGIGLPFREPSFVLGTGQKAQRIGSAIDRTGNAIKAAPGVRHLRSLFDVSAGGSSNALTQSAFADAALPAMDAGQSATRLTEYNLRDRFGKILNDLAPHAGGEREALNLLRSAALGASEGIDPAEFARLSSERLARGVAPGIDDPQALANIQGVLTGHWGDIQGIGSEIKNFGKETLASARKLGVRQADLGDEFVDYVSRRSASSQPGVQSGGEVLSTRNGSNISRKDVLRNIPGGDVQINTWAMDPRLTGAGKLADADRRAIILDDMVQNALGQGVNLTPDITKNLEDKADDLLGFIAGVGEHHSAGKVPYFDQNIFEDVSIRGNRAAKAEGSAKAFYDAINKAAVPIGNLKNGVTIKDLLKRAGLVNKRLYQEIDLATDAILKQAGLNSADEARELLKRAASGDQAAQAAAATLPRNVVDMLKSFKVEGAYPQAYESLAKHLPFVGDVTNRNFKRIDRAISGFGIDAADADALTKFMKGWSTPSEVEPFVKGFDSLQNLFKAWSYSAWPSSHVRNFVSAMYNNFVHGANFDDARAAFSLMREGKLDPSMFANYRLPATMLPEEAAKDLIGRAYAHGKVFHGPNSASDFLGAGVGGAAPGQIVPSLPGTGIAGNTGSFVGDSLNLAKEAGTGLLTREGANPLGVAGVGGRTVDTNSLVKAGRTLGSNIENFARLQSYLAGIRNGLDDAASGALTRKIHFDYSAMTPFEKNVMRRLVPFYTYARKNLPFQVEQLINQPSRIGLPLRAFDAARGDTYVPEYMQNSLAVPIGQEKDGTQRFMSSFGLPFEEALGHIKMDGAMPSLSKTALNYMGTMTPFIKGPLEQIMDKQFHTGRNLSDLRPTGVASAFGNLDEDVAQPIAQFLANTPATRFISAIDKISDPRKGVVPKAANLLSGFKVSDVNMEKMRAIDAREMLSRMLAGNSNVSKFTNYYVKPENRQALTPEDILQLQLFAAYKERAKQAAEQERLKGSLIGVGLR